MIVIRKIPLTVFIHILILIAIFVNFPGQADLLPTHFENTSIRNDTNARSDITVPIGILVMKSGFVSDIGLEYLRAFDLAKKQHPWSNSIPVIVDGGSNRSVAEEHWNILKQSRPDIPVVATVASWTSNVVYPDAARSGMVQIAIGSAAINQSAASDRLVRFTPGVLEETPVLASYLDRYDRIAMVGADNELSNSYFSALEKLLPESIVTVSRYNQDSVNSTLNITEITNSNPDIILLLSISEGAMVVDRLRSASITVPLVGTRLIERDSLAEMKSAEGLVFTTPVLNTSHPFFATYREMYGENATFYGAEGYDAMDTLYSVLDACSDDADCMYSWYQNRSYNGTLGSVIFNNRGVASYPIGFKIIHHGRFEPYGPK